MSTGLETSKPADMLVTLFHTDCNGARKQKTAEISISWKQAPPQKHIC